MQSIKEAGQTKIPLQGKEQTDKEDQYIYMPIDDEPDECGHQNEVHCILLLRRDFESKSGLGAPQSQARCLLEAATVLVEKVKDKGASEQRSEASC